MCCVLFLVFLLVLNQTVVVDAAAPQDSVCLASAASAVARSRSLSAGSGSTAAFALAAAA